MIKPLAFWILFLHLIGISTVDAGEGTRRFFLLAGGSDGDGNENQFAYYMSTEARSVSKSGQELTVLFDGDHSRDEAFLTRAGVMRNSWDYRSFATGAGISAKSIGMNTNDNILKFIDRADQTAADNPQQRIQSVLDFNTHGSLPISYGSSDQKPSIHILSTEDPSGLSEKDVILNRKLASLSSRPNASVGIIDASCFGGNSVSAFKKYACVLTNQVASAVSCGDSAGMNLRNLIEKNSSALLFPEHQKVTMEELYLATLLNPLEDIADRKDGTTCLMQPQFSAFDDPFSERFNQLLQLTPPPNLVANPECDRRKELSDIENWVDEISKITDPEGSDVANAITYRIAEGSDAPWLLKAIHSLTGSSRSRENFASNWQKTWAQFKPLLQQIHDIQKRDATLLKKMSKIGVDIKNNIILTAESPEERDQNAQISAVLFNSRRYPIARTGTTGFTTDINIEGKLASTLVDPEKIAEGIAKLAPKNENTPEFRAKLVKIIRQIELDPGQIQKSGQELEGLKTEYKGITSEFKARSQDPKFRQMRIELNTTLSKLRAYAYLAQREKIMKTPESQLSPKELEQRKQIKLCGSIELN